jgi:uncharacterized membrane protein
MKISAKFLDAILWGLFGLGLVLTTYLASLSAFTDLGRLCSVVGSDCLGAVHSAYGRVFGFSVASFGIGYFAFQLILVVLLSRRTPIAALLSETQLLGAFLAAGVSLFFLYVLRFVLVQDCIGCYGVHAVNAAALALCLVRRFHMLKGPGRLFSGLLRRPLKLGPALAIPILISLNVTLFASLLEMKALYKREQGKIQNNLEYYRYLYKASPLHSFNLESGDLLLGEPAIALHEIVLFYKEGCGHCRAAREKLAELVRKHDSAVYLVVREVSRMSPSALENLQVRQVPAVFIDGRLAEGWQLPGFLETFAKDCGC